MTMRGKQYLSRAQCWSVLAAGAAIAVATSDAQAQDWTRHFRIGMQLALNIDAEFSMGGDFFVPFQEGIFDDGYVLDDDTGSAQGLTTHWGYQNASQVVGNTIEFHRIDSFSVASSTTKV